MTFRDEILEILGPAGPVARRLGGYERRPQQEELCGAVADTLDQGGVLVAEAGTGVGKSFAYLLPAIRWAVAKQVTVVISTRTKALQQQLAEKDLPFLQAVLPDEFTWAVAMGRGNYVCLRRLEAAVAQATSLFPEMRRVEELAAIESWAFGPAVDGLRHELSFVPDPGVWAEVQAEQGNCLGQACRHFAPCHWQRGKRRMRTARLLIVNHALYFSDLALRIAGHPYLPEHDCVVFDEAHHLEPVASETLGLRLSPAQVEWQLSRLRGKGGGLLGRLGLSTLAAEIDELRDLSHHYFEGSQAQLDASGDETLRLGREAAVPDVLAEPLGRFAKQLLAAAESLERETAMELTSRANRLLEIAAQAAAFARPATEGHVRWIERERRQAVLRAAPIEVGPQLAKHLFAKQRVAIAVSATLGPPESGFAWLRERLGIGKARTLLVGSPFPFEDNVELVVEEGLPDPASDSRAFDGEAARRVAELCLENGGRALVLCTSWRFLDACREALAAPLSAAGIELLAQGDRPLAQLVERKRQVKESVLLGTDSLWEGIDIPGDAVTLVVLTRFPFPLPTQPLVAARCEALEAQGKSSFEHYTLPLALLKFRQGFGRLVRSATDRGKVVVLDPRARRKAYGRRFLAALPRCRGEAAPDPGAAG